MIILPLTDNGRVVGRVHLYDDVARRFPSVPDGWVLAPVVENNEVVEFHIVAIPATPAVKESKDFIVKIRYDDPQSGPIIATQRVAFVASDKPHEFTTAEWEAFKVQFPNAKWWEPEKTIHFNNVPSNDYGARNVFALMYDRGELVTAIHIKPCTNIREGDNLGLVNVQFLDTRP